jgi:hypothetical protein
MTAPAWPRVTAVMAAAGVSPDYSMVDPVALREASERGSLVHKLIELSHVEPDRPPRIPWHVRGYMRAYERFCDETQHEPIASELEVRHEAWRYIGHVDRIGWHGTRRVLLDWKCVSSLDEAAVGVQLAAYQSAFAVMSPQEPIHVCAAIQLRPDGSYRMFEADVAAARPIWQAAVVLYHWRLKNTRIAPRLY